MITSVVAEHAPLGVQLWPTLTPDKARHFTLQAVEIVRSTHATYVRWIYEDGKVRRFDLGETVVVKLPARANTRP